MKSVSPVLEPKALGTISRRDLFVAAAPLGAIVLIGSATAEATAPSVAPTTDPFPRQPPELARDVVLHAHFDIDRVRELIGEWPELAKSSWDWGFGDWESALDAASHTGRREIAKLLIERGARPTLFTHAMFGHLDVIRAAVAVQPGIQAIPGPHGITLLAHARAGGDAAAQVLAFLEEVGDADPAPTALPLPLPLGAYMGRYMVAGSERTFEMVEHQAGLAFAVEGTPSRPLVHLGESLFHPVGAPSVRMEFRLERREVIGIEIVAGAERLVAARSSRRPPGPGSS